MYSQESGDKMVECPYDSCHQMLRKNLQKHLLKCKLNYPNVELQTCPFDKIHLVKEEDYVNHINNCPARALIFQNKLKVKNNKVEAEEIVKHEPIECEENWDDTEFEDYNPLQNASASVLKRRPAFPPCDGSAQIGKKIKRESYKNEQTDDFIPNKSEKKEGDVHRKGKDKPKATSKETVGIYCFIDDRSDDCEPFSTSNNVDSHTFYEGRGSPSPPPPPPIISNYVPTQGNRNRYIPPPVPHLSSARETNKYNFSSHNDVYANTSSLLSQRQSYGQVGRRENLRRDEQMPLYENAYYNGHDSARQDRWSHANARLTRSDNPHYFNSSQQSTQGYLRGSYHNMNNYYSNR